MRLRFNVQIVPALIRIDDEASLRRAPARGLHALPIVFASQLALKQLVGLCRGACIRLHLGGIAKAHCVSGGERLRGRKACKLPYRSEEHTSELQSLMRISYAVFCLKKKKKKVNNTNPADIGRHTNEQS